MQKPRSMLLSITLLLITIASGLLIRFGPLGLPFFVVKYGGSILWALMIYWIISSSIPMVACGGSCYPGRIACYIH